MQEFNLEIKDECGAEILVADHLSRLENLNKDFIKKQEIEDSFPEEHLYSILVVNNENPSQITHAFEEIPWMPTLQIVWQRVLS